MSPKSAFALLIVVVSPLAAGCGGPSLVGSCKTPGKHTCEDLYDVEATASDAEQTCTYNAGVWSSGACDQSGALGSCQDETVSQFGIESLYAVDWYWPGAIIGTIVLETSQDVAHFCAPATVPGPSSDAGASTSTCAPGPSVELGPPVCSPPNDADAGASATQAWCGVATGPLQQTLVGTVNTYDPSSGPTSTITLRMAGQMDPLAIFNPVCGTFAPGTYARTQVSGDFTLPTTDVDANGNGVIWTTQLGGGTVTLVLDTVGPGVEEGQGISNTHGTLTMVLNRSDSLETANLTVVF